MSYNEPEPADGVALLRAHLAGDEELIRALLSTVDERALLPMVIGQLLRMMANAGLDAAAVDAELDRWQREQLLS